MQLKKLFGICSLALLLTSCLRPEKPIVEVCQIDFGQSEAICGLSGQGANTKVTRFPLSDLDKATALKPKQWKVYKDYIDLLEVYATELEKRDCN